MIRIREGMRAGVACVKDTFPLSLSHFALLFGLFFLFNSTAHAIGGITSDNAAPHFATNQNREDLEDLRVKVLGGYVRMTRRWDSTRQRWEWNSRWSGPEKQNYLRFKRSNTNYIYSRMDGINMVFEDRSGNHFLLENKWDNLQHTREHGYEYPDLVWRDLLGNSINFTHKIDRGLVGGNLARIAPFKVKHYSDKNNVQVNIEHDENGLISVIKDHHQNVVITYTWEQVPGFTRPRLVKLTDYTGREVNYEYAANGDLSSVTDVRGEVWRYDYASVNGSHRLLKQTDPSERTTKYASTDTTTTTTYPNGNQVTHTEDYDKKTEITYKVERHSSGRFIETWSDELGHIVRRQVNGELEYTAEYVLSEGTLKDIKNAYKTQHWLTHDSDNGKYCGYIGSNPVWITVYGAGSSRAFQRCSYKRADGIPAETCGNTCVRNSAYYNALNEDQNNPLQPKEPPTITPPPYVKSKTVTDARSNKTLYEYDRWGNELRVTYPDGSTVERTWLVKYTLPLTVKNQNDVVTEYEYDSKGNLLTLTEAKDTQDERITRYTYDDYGQLKTVTTGESVANNTALATTHYDYDQYGNLISIIDPMGNETRFGDFDVLGNAATITDPRANQQPEPYSWTKTYDPAGNLLTDFDSYGKGTIYSYNKSGDLASVTEANGATTDIETNTAGLPVVITDAAEQSTRIEYNSAKLPTAMIDANGNRAQLFYNGAGQLTRLIDGENNTTRYDYENNLLKKIHHPRYAEELAYDNRNRASSIQQLANDKNYLREQDFDLRGNLLQEKDANTNASIYEYDKLDRLVKMTDAEGGITRFQYDARDNLVEVKDPEERVTTYQYDLTDQLISETLAGGLRQYGYNANGNLISHINPAGEKITYTYDQADRQTSMALYATAASTQPIKVVNYNINAQGQFTGYTQQAGTTAQGNSAPGITPDIIPLSETYTYTTLNQLESVTANFGSFSKTYSYTYYPNGLKQTYTNPEGITYTYYYNKNSQLTAVHIPGNGQLTYSNFTWLVPQTLLLPGGNKITLKYNDFLQVEERILKDPANNDVASAIYQYDLESNINQILSEQGTYNFGYDNLYRLTSATYPESNAANDESFVYDGVGNRTTHTQTDDEDETFEATLGYNNHNQLMQSTAADSTATFTYNANGHTATKVENGTTTEYVYNHEERLIAVRINNVTVGEYAYNPNGMRVKKTVNGATTYYLYNENGLAAEYDSSGNLIKEYHFHPQQTWMTEPLFQRTASNQVFYYQNDHLGTPQRMIQSNGAVVWQASYTAFGEATIAATSTIENNLRFPGQYYDQETHLHHNYFRDYDPIIGRYLQSDPIGLRGGMNTYVYVLNNPLFYIDPDGLNRRSSGSRSNATERSWKKMPVHPFSPEHTERNKHNKCPKTPPKPCGEKDIDHEGNEWAADNPIASGWYHGGFRHGYKTWRNPETGSQCTYDGDTLVDSGPHMGTFDYKTPADGLGAHYEYDVKPHNINNNYVPNLTVQY